MITNEKSITLAKKDVKIMLVGGIAIRIPTKDVVYFEPRYFQDNWPWYKLRVFM